jgi:surfeit locus 1 family protein
MSKGQHKGQEPPFVPAGLNVRGAQPGAVFKPLTDLSSADQAASATQNDLALLPVSVEPNPLFDQKVPSKAQLGFRPMPVLSVLTVLCLAILLYLGQWQWEKFKLKSQPTLPVVAQAPVAVTAALESPNPEYQTVIVDGISDQRTLLIGAVQDSVRGFRLFTPVILEAGMVFVDRGFVDEAALARIVEPPSQVRYTGVLRKGAKANAYTPDNDPAKNQWFWPDIPVMTRLLGLQSVPATSGRDYYVALSKVDPLGTGQTVDNPYASPQGANPIPAERHLGYALTWWGFGLALVGVYIGLHVRTGRLTFGHGKRAVAKGQLER